MPPHGLWSCQHVRQGRARRARRRGRMRPGRGARDRSRRPHRPGGVAPTRPPGRRRGGRSCPRRRGRRHLRRPGVGRCARAGSRRHLGRHPLHCDARGPRRARLQGEAAVQPRRPDDGQPGLLRQDHARRAERVHRLLRLPTPTSSRSSRSSWVWPTATGRCTSGGDSLTEGVDVGPGVLPRRSGSRRHRPNSCRPESWCSGSSPRQRRPSTDSRPSVEPGVRSADDAHQGRLTARTASETRVALVTGANHGIGAAHGEGAGGTGRAVVCTTTATRSSAGWTTRRSSGVPGEPHGRGRRRSWSVDRGPRRTGRRLEADLATPPRPRSLRCRRVRARAGADPGEQRVGLGGDSSPRRDGPPRPLGAGRRRRDHRPGGSRGRPGPALLIAEFATPPHREAAASGDASSD